MYVLYSRLFSRKFSKIFRESVIASTTQCGNKFRQINFSSENVTFTEFLSKMRESKFP